LAFIFQHCNSYRSKRYAEASSPRQNSKDRANSFEKLATSSVCEALDDPSLSVHPFPFLFNQIIKLFYWLNLGPRTWIASKYLHTSYQRLNCINYITLPLWISLKMFPIIFGCFLSLRRSLKVSDWFLANRPFLKWELYYDERIIVFLYHVMLFFKLRCSKPMEIER
jgi:hypothetical protein